MSEDEEWLISQSVKLKESFQQSVLQSMNLVFTSGMILLKGEVEFEGWHIGGDWSYPEKDGYPTLQLAVVVDDHNGNFTRYPWR